MSQPEQNALDSRFWVHALGASLIALALSWLLVHTEGLKRLNLHLFDLQAKLLGPAEHFDDLLVIDIDEQSMTQLRPKLGVWPYERYIYAATTEFLRTAGAKAIVFDIVFADERKGDTEFAQVLQQTSNVALASATIFRSPEPNAEDLRDLQQAAWPVEGAVPANALNDITLPRRALLRSGGTHTGMIRVTPDPDGRLRRVPLLHHIHDYYLPSLPLAALFAGEAKPPIAFSPAASDIAIGHKLYRVNASGEVMLKFPRDLNSVDVLPFHQLVAAIDDQGDGKAVDAMVQRVRDKKVFIGSSTAVLGDHVQTLYGHTAGLLALAASTAMLERDLVLRPPHWAIDATLLALAAGLPLLAFRRSERSDPWLSLAALAASVLLVIAITSALYWRGQASALVLPLLATVLVFAALTLLRLFVLYQERQRLAMEKMAAEQAYELKSQFISQMTHELRTPLAAIMGFNKLIAETGVTDKSRDEYSTVIAKNSDHLMTLINNMLDQSKLEAGQIKINKAPARIREVIEDVTTTLSTLARDKRLNLTSHVAPNVPPALEIDAFRLRQVLINLTGNAIKFTQQGDVSVNAEWHQAELKLTVRDTGPGISPAALRRIFEPFQQGADTTERVHGGTGLGLSISRNFCELMGGRLEVESKLGKGSAFIVLLPAREAAVETPTLRPQAQPVAGEKLSGRVLLADDNQDIRELVSRYLAKMGLEVLTAKDGAEAVAVATKHDVQLVLMDMEMPIMRGNTAVTKLRTAGFTRPILALTAHPEGPEVEQALRDGCDGYVAKPVNRERLFATLRTLLQQPVRSSSNTAAAIENQG